MNEPTATNFGPFPGTDAFEACSILLGELGSPHLPTLPLLPDRGVGADAVGRTAAMLAELPVELTSFGWRFSDKPGLDLHRAQSWLSSDVNALADVVGQQRLSVPDLQLSLVGPVTLAAQLYLPGGERVISDAGAVRELAASQREGLAGFVTAARQAVPGVDLQLTVAEPMAHAGIAGTIDTVSGYRRLPPVERATVAEYWSEIGTRARSLGTRAVHLAGHLDLLPTVREAGLDGATVTAAALGPRDWESLAEALETQLYLTLRLSLAAGVPETARSLWRDLRDVGLGAAHLGSIRLTEAAPPASPAEARALLSELTGTAAALAELAHG